MIMKRNMKYMMLGLAICAMTSCSDDFLQTDSPNQP